MEGLFCLLFFVAFFFLLIGRIINRVVSPYNYKSAVVYSRKTSKSKNKTVSSVDRDTNAASSVTSLPKREKSARCERQAGVKQVCLTPVSLMLERSSVTELRFFPF